MFSSPTAVSVATASSFFWGNGDCVSEKGVGMVHSRAGSEDNEIIASGSKSHSEGASEPEDDGDSFGYRNHEPQEINHDVIVGIDTQDVAGDVNSPPTLGWRPDFRVDIHEVVTVERVAQNLARSNEARPTNVILPLSATDVEVQPEAPATR